MDRRTDVNLKGLSDFNKASNDFSQLFCESTENDKLLHNFLRQYTPIVLHIKVMRKTAPNPTISSTCYSKTKCMKTREFILVNDQHDAQLFYSIVRLLQSSTCVEQRRAHHQEVKLY